MKKKKIVYPALNDLEQEIANYEQERRVANLNKASLYRDYSLTLLNSNVGDRFSPANQSNIGSEDTPWYEDAFDFIKNIPSNVYDFVTEDVPNSLRMLDEKINEGHLATTESRMSDNNDDKRNIKFIEEYIDLLKQYRELLSDAKAFGTDLLFQKQLKEIRNRLDQYDEYFKTTGRTNPVVADLMYNDGKTLSAGDEVTGAAAFIGRGQFDIKSPTGVWDAAKGLLKVAGNTLIHVGQGLEYGYTALTDRKGLMEDVVRNVDDKTAEGKAIIDKLYNGDNTNILDVEKRLQQWNMHAERLDRLYNNWYKSDLKRYKEGLTRLAIPFTDNEIFIKTSDPEDVPDDWRTQQLIHAGEFWSHPLYTLPEVGSTIGLASGMVGSMVADGFARMVIRELPTVMLTPEAKLLKFAKMYKSPLMLEKATALMEKAAASNTKYQLARAGVLSADVSAGIWLTKEARKLETAQESAEAQKQRLLRALDNSDADPQTVYYAIARKAQQLGIDVDQLNPDDLMGLAIAYDINTGDEAFDKAKADSRKGLMKLINANNALAVVDYAQTLPFLSFGERILSDFAKVSSQKLGAAGILAPRIAGWKDKGLWKAIKENYSADLANAKYFQGMPEKTAQSLRYADEMLSVYDNRVYSFAEKLMKKDHRILGLMANHTAQWAKPTIAKYLHVGFLEGLEEGQLEILQKRYQRGEYDDYLQSYSIFDIPEVLNNVDLSKDVIKAWFGIGTEDIDDIRKASLIGASASLFFPFIGRAATGAIHTHDNHFANLLGQLNTDWAMRKMISDNYREIHDHNHLSMYYDMFRKGGVDNIRLRRALNNLKQTVDEQSTFASPEYIDDDMQLMENAWTAYKDELFAKNLASNGVKKYSPEYKTAVINYARALTDLWEDNKGILKGTKDKNSFENSVLQKLLSYIDPNLSEEQKAEIVDEMPEIKSIASAFKRLHSTYKSGFEEHLERDKQNVPVVKQRYKDLLRSYAETPEELLKDKHFYSALEQYFVLIGELRDTNLSPNHAYIARQLLSIISNGDLFESILNNAVSARYAEEEKKLQNLQPLSEEDHIKLLANQYAMYQQLKRAQAMLLMLQDQAKTQQDVRLLTGRDIKTDKIKGMISGIKELIETLQKEEKEMFGKNGELNKMFEDLNLSYPNQQEYNKIVDGLMLFTAISNPHRKIASAYMYDRIHGEEKISPEEFIDAIFGETVNVADPLYNKLIKISNEYKQLLALQEEESNLAKKQGSAEARDLFVTEKRAANAVVMDEIRQAEQRVRIAHKQYEEDARETLLQEEQPIVESQQEEPAEGSIEAPVEVEPEEKKPLVLDPDLEEDSIIETLDNDGEETRRKKAALRRMEEAELRRREEQEGSTLEEKQEENSLFAQPYIDRMNAAVTNYELEQAAKDAHAAGVPEKDWLPSFTRNEARIARLKKDVESLDTNEVLLVKIPMTDGFVLFVNYNGYVYEVIANVTSVLEEDDKLITTINLSYADKLSYSIKTDALGAGYSYTDDNEQVSGITGFIVVRTKNGENGILNSPSEIRVIGHDNDILGMFVQTQDNPLDDTDTTPPVVSDEEKGAPEIVGEQPVGEITGENDEIIPEVTGEDLTVIPDVTGEGVVETPVVTGENNTPITINTLGFDDTQGFIDQYGVPLTPKEQETIYIQDEILTDIDFYKNYNAQFGVPRKNTRDDIQDEGDVGDYLSLTLFYDPNGETPIDLKINGEQIKLKYPLRPGKELAQKLLNHQWLKDCYKYFVVTQAQDAAYKSANDPDSFTVTLIIEDDLNNASYAVSYRQLGKYLSKGKVIRGESEVEEEFFVDHEQELREFLLSVHGVGETTAERLRNYRDTLYGVIMEKEFLHEATQEIIEGKKQALEEHEVQEARRKAVSWLKNKPSIRRNETEERFASRKQQYEAKLSYYTEVARDRISRRNREKIPAADIEKQISKLRENRLLIINKYLHHHEENGQTVYDFPKPTETKRTVTADNIVLSNGKFDNQKAGEQPIVNNISKLNNKFGIKNTTEDISKQIKDGEISIGVGSGDFRSNNSYIISDFRKGVQWQHNIQRGGVAGKIYLVIDTPTGNLVPLMLLEQKFDKQHDLQGGYNSAMQESKLQLCLDIDGSIINNDVLPSAAEVLLYLLTGNITSDQFSGLSKELQKQFADLFVNNGENTILKDSNIEDLVPSYAAKLLLVIQRSNGKNDLIIGMPVFDGDGIETGKYRLTFYKNELLFAPENEDLRKQVVKAIARQMHWNTDRETMGLFFGGNKTRLIVDYLERYFKNNPSEETYSLYGVPEFTFNKNDIFEVDETGVPTKIKGDVYVASWMIKTGKIYTDVSDNIFKDPWVFVASNAKDNSSDTVVTGENNAVKTKTGDVDINKTIEEQNKKLKKQPKPAPTKEESLNLFDEEKYNRLPGILKQKKVVKEESLETLPKKILISDPLDAGKKYEDKKAFAEYLKTRLEALAKELNDSGKFSVKITLPDNIEDYVTKGIAFEQMRRRYIDPKNTSKIYPVVSINADGTMHLQHSNYQRQTGAILVNGVYQTQKTGGIMNREQAITWLNEKLGIPEHDILVTDIIMTSVENGEEVFGVMDVVFDTLREEFAGVFRLNPISGRGLHYHEAWHYVNLLIHDTTTQTKLFDAYANSHPEYKGKSHIEIEEALAEEFRMWMELRNTEGFINKTKGIIKRFFYAVSDALRLSGDKGKYRAVFRKINSGQYKSKKLSDQSIKEFKKFYKNGVYSIYAPGFDRTSLDNISKTVSNTDDFLAVVDAIGDYIMLSIDIKTQDDLKSLCSDNFPSVLEDLEVLNNTDDISDGVKPVIRAFLENPEAIRYTIVKKLKDFGIITKKDSISNARAEEESENEENGTEDEPWNIFDRFLFTVSKKQNAAFLAKLFMHTIPMKHWAPRKDGLMDLEDTPNEIIPIIPKIMPYDEVWNRLLDEFKNLNNSWGQKNEDGNYEPYSFRWIVKKQAELNDPLFATIDEMLDDIEDDTQLKAQLVTTLNSQKPNISQFELINAYRIQTELEKLIREGYVDLSAIDQATLDQDRKEGDAFALADRNKKWELLNDNSLRAARSIPREWSNRILTYGLVDYKNDGKISKEYYKILEKKYNAIFSILNEYFGRRVKTQLQKELKIEEIKQMSIELLQQMGVSVDMETLNFYLYSRIGKGNITEDELAKEIRAVFDKYTTGTFGYVLNLIKSNIGKNEFGKVARKKGGSEIKKDLNRSLEIDALYTGTSLNSIITKMALAKFATHPGSAEYGVRDAKGNMLYPVSQNSFISSKQRLLNTTGGEEARKMLRDPYAKNSLILNLAKTFSINQSDTDQLKFNVHVGLSGKLEDNGSDYFDITSIEDYIMKMILLDQDPTFGGVEKNNESTHLVLPTMADKKTYGDISHRELRTAHEPFFGLLTEEQKRNIYSQEYYNQTVDDYIEDTSLSNLMRERWIDNLTADLKEWFIRKYSQTNPMFNRYSDNTLKIFANYFLDEIEALRLYYSKENILFLLDNPTKIKKNFHGKIEEIGGKKRLSFSGNGGLFRYFYDSVHTDIYDNSGKEINLNQKLEFLYNLEKQFISGGEKSKIRIKGASDIDDVQFMSLSSISPDAQSLDDLDGFELIRNELENIKNQYFDIVYDNNKPIGITPTQQLLSGINEHLLALLDDEMTALCVNPNIELAKKIGNMIVPVSIPAQLLSRQFLRFKDAGLVSGKYTPYSKKSRRDGTDALMLKSLVANHIANTAISIIEFEKVFQGDSSFFKYGYLTDENRNDVTTKVSTEYTLPDGTVVESKQDVKIVSEKETDKIKRLGSLLSPGDELMLSYTEEDYEKYKNLTRGDKFTNIVVSDINAKSKYIDSALKPMIKRHLLVDYIRSNNFEPIQKYVKSVQKREGENNFDLERAINQIYLGFKIEIDGVKTTLFDYLYEQLDDVHKKMIEQRTEQKTKPFGKINVADAQVLIRPLMYRKIRIGLGKWTEEDEEAFWILETDASWMSDPEKAEKVSKLELFPLKMAYYANDPEQYEKGVYVNTPVLGKQAIFPWFKYHASSEVGMDIYNRMNKKGSELDFMSFDSAVKVGAPQYLTSLYDKGTEVLGKMSDDFLKESSDYITKSGNVKHRTGDTQPVLIQDLKYLRYQLNTQSHKAHERAIGTQMFKIAFSNIEDDSMYGIRKKGILPRLGREIRKDIMRNISLLTKIGAFTIEQEFYDKHGKVDKAEMQKWTRRIIENNDLGATADDIIKNGFIAESLMNRKTFEQAVSKLVNKEVVDISTKGGTAVQQSAFGFNSYDGSQVDFWDGNTYHKYNDGKPILWISDNDSGTMLVLLGANFFKSVVPEEYRSDYKKMRDWLLENNIIGSKAKPYGVGYRIPTQGQSSMFVFQVADVLPEQQGDVIVVPNEFTAQTGSDFDVDKLFLATMSYTGGQYDTIEDDLYNYFVSGKGDVEELCRKYGVYWRTDFKKVDLKQSDKPYYKDRADFDHSLVRQKEALNKLFVSYKGAIQNRLLQDYMIILSDIKMFTINRGSIDVISDAIHEDVLSWLKPTKTSYQTGMYELMPSFLSMKKLEFSVGKAGISIFALNITNLALTQYSHLALDIEGDNPYGLKPLDCIRGEDDNYTADWLSAMINACVDVAKDPYIFVLNANQTTFDTAAFLLRSGKGISTFTFLAQPILKQYAAQASVSGGIYGNNITGWETAEESKRRKDNLLKQNLLVSYMRELENMRKQFSDKQWSKVSKEIQEAYGEAVLYIKYKYTKDFTPKQKGAIRAKNKHKTPSLSPNSSVFDFEAGKKYILDFSSENLEDRIASYLYQIKVLKAYIDLEPYVRKMSDLVQTSQIDTKKFGNDIVQQLNYEARIRIFKYTSSGWIINTKNERDASRLIPGYALGKYYRTMFLEEKFAAARKYTKELLSTQLLVASDSFETLFKDIAKELNGFTTYDVPIMEYNKETKKYEYKFETKNGKKEVAKTKEQMFTPFYSEKSIEAISAAINNIARFNILMNYGIRQQNRKLIGDESNLYETPIDFSFGGDFSKLIRNISDLLFGNREEKSLPGRLFDFISDILKDPNSEEAEGLVEDGKIINPFLAYLQPYNKTDEVPIDRLLLNDSLFRTSKNKKDILASSWYTLLTHPSEKVRKLANDIALYSYYTTYDTPAINSITDLIPAMFRTKYDSALKNALSRNEAKLLEYMSLDYFIKAMSQESRSVFNEHMTPQSLFIDIICRNYYYNNDIVKSIDETGNGHLSHKSQSQVEWRGVTIRTKEKNYFSGIIATSVSPRGTTTHPIYVKIRKGNETMLYKCIGVINKTAESKKGEKKIMDPLYVYVAVLKAGLHIPSKKLHMFEFYANEFIPSLFRNENILPEKFTRKNLLDTLIKQIEVWNNDKVVKEQKATYVFTNDEEIASGLFSDSYNGMVYRSKNATMFEDPIVNDKDIFYSAEKKFSPFGHKNYADVIISINKDQGEYNDKTLHIGKSGEFIDAIDNYIVQHNLSGDIQLTVDSDVSVVAEDGQSTLLLNKKSVFYPTQQEVDEYVDLLIDMSLEELVKKNPYLTLSEIAEYREELKLLSKQFGVERNVAIKKLATAISNMINYISIKHPDVKIKQLRINGMSLDAIAAIAVQKALSENIEYKMSLKVDRAKVGTDQYKDFLNLYKSNITISQEDIYDSYENDTPQEGVLKLLEQYIPEAEEETDEDFTEEPMSFDFDFNLADLADPDAEVSTDDIAADKAAEDQEKLSDPTINKESEKTKEHENC